MNAARVSFHKTSEWEYENPHDWHNIHRVLSEKDQKLISYLAKHKHWTPFAHAFLSFRIKAPVFVARQMVKHQVGLVWNEVSRRYVDEEPEFFAPLSWRKRPDGSVKQGSSITEVITEIQHLDIGINEYWTSPIERSFYNYIEASFSMYQDMLRAGVAPEQARMVLPQNTMTEWIWSGSLAAFARVCKLRLDPHAQEETRQVAQQINDLVPEKFEHSWKALIEN